ncbi:putative UDP-N-acetylglucosamine--peptide N-acetylglucosaminyltransferase SPINDLY [Camellia lanceoleosa]|uniref:UDP-N-acetylglucosamine--peptide N-acetylglucosaminyltransferase SPINDLY n=1 Tax=Camellia lanceoleosa TaxID=1840588 RepID=A0ACC0GFM3_9ERIC|nr:putative UDP-N-acetylglucosamine--peptide N-acetylglucosaminyltransferase SPINDLY [Camellia lanceoleosa]
MCFFLIVVYPDGVDAKGCCPGQKKFEGKVALSYANILHSRNKFVDALALYESILEKDCGNVDARIGKGICLQIQNMERLAFESFPAYYNLGVVYSEMMQYDMALGCYEKAALERPMYAEAYCNMGVIYKNHGDIAFEKEIRRKRREKECLLTLHLKNQYYILCLLILFSGDV